MSSRARTPRDLTDPRAARHFTREIARSSRRTLSQFDYDSQPVHILSDDESPQLHGYTPEQVELTSRAYKKALREQRHHDYKTRRGE